MKSIEMHTAIERKKELIWFTVFLLFFAILSKAGFHTWNDASRFAQIQALADNHNLIIDKTVFPTGGKYFYGGHFYSDKPPLLAIISTPIYFLLKIFGLSFVAHQQVSTFLVTLLTIGCLSAVGLIFYRRTLIQFLGTSKRWANLLTVAVAGGTLILPYSLVYNNHIPSGAFLMLGSYYLFSFNASSKAIHVMLSGFFFSLAFAIDIGCFVFIPVVSIALLIRTNLSAMLTFLLGCLPMISLYFLITWVTSGSFLAPAMNLPLWNYPGSHFNETNLSGLATHASMNDLLNYAYHMLIRDRGIISHTPLLLVSIFGIAYGYKNKRLVNEFWLLLVLGICFFYLASYILRTNNYGGWSYGVRWYASLMYLLCLPLAFLENPFYRSRRIRVMMILVAVISVLLSLLGSVNPFSSIIKERLPIWLKQATILQNWLTFRESIHYCQLNADLSHCFLTGRTIIAACLLFLLLAFLTKTLLEVSTPLKRIETNSQ